MATSGSGRRAERGLRWTIFLIAAFAALLALGWYGFHRYGGGGQSWLDELYASLQLFGLNFQSQPGVDVPAALQVARFLAPVATASAFIGAFVAIFSEHVARRRVQWVTRGHVVVCGLGRIGGLLAPRLRRAGYRVVAIEPDPSNPSIGECRAAGVVVLQGNATDRALLEQTIRRARYLFAVAGDDEANLRVAVDARELARTRSGSPLSCFVHLLDAELAELLFRAEIGASRAQGIRFEYFNTSELGAPRMFEVAGVSDDDLRGAARPLVVVGCGEMGRRVILHAARRRRGSVGGDGAGRLAVHVVDRSATGITSSLLERHPGLDRICQITPWDVRVEDHPFDTAEYLTDPLAVFVCLPSDAGGLSAALRVRHRLGDPAPPIVVRTTEQARLGTLLALAEAEAYENVHVFPLMEVVCQPDTLMRGRQETVARAIHERYLRDQVDAGKELGSSPAVVPWEELPEGFKESNRAQADDIGRKLEAVHCFLAPIFLWEGPAVEFAPEEVERLAKIEHDRWWEERLAAGYRFGPVKGERTKETPYLVPWDQLDEDKKDIDRNLVRSLPDFLSEIGFLIVRRG